MRITEKIKLINKLTDVMKEKYDNQDLEIFFGHYKLDIVWYGWGNNKEDYDVDIKQTLAKASNEILISISSELETGSEYIVKEYPQVWKNSKKSLKVFISHLSSNKEVAQALKEALKPYYIDCFVAHEDIMPTLEWQVEIIKALNTMDVFISLHCENFKNSVWCQQEIGIAYAKNIKIIPIKFDGKEDPCGFISKIQGLHRRKKDRNALAKEIVAIIKESSMTKEVYANICSQNTPLIDETEIPF